MHHKIVSTLFTLILITLVACNNHPAKNTTNQQTDRQTAREKEIADSIATDSTLILNKDSQEAVYRPSSLSSFKTAYNQVFNFAFELPKQWRAIDASTIGDGYYIFTGKKFTDIRIYGEMITPVNEKVLAELDSNDFNKIEKFTFDDGSRGLKLSGRVYRMYIKDHGKIRISLYVKARKNWLQKNDVYLEHMAQSIRQIHKTK
ncbi:MAG: hypothetical protein Q8908_05455 [Bacteroidota bacterium]|nr:hypothetical protein [Bacteroidota bacterium]